MGSALSLGRSIPVVVDLLLLLYCSHDLLENDLGDALNIGFWSSQPLNAQSSRCTGRRSHRGTRWRLM